MTFNNISEKWLRDGAKRLRKQLDEEEAEAERLARANKNNPNPTPQSPLEDVVNGENVLVFSEKNKIYVIDIDKEIHEIAKRTDYINALCSHDGKLYDGGNYNQVIETSTGDIITERTSVVTALCSHPREYFVQEGILVPKREILGGNSK